VEITTARPGAIVLPEWYEQTLLREQWTRFLLRFPMQWFCTMTFRDRVHPEAADKAWRVFCSKLNRTLYGNRWWKDPKKGVFWIRALERQKRTVIHYHALVGAPRHMDELAHRLSWMDEWHLQTQSFARIYTIQSEELVRRYVSKYVTKGGEIDLSPTLDHWWRQQQLLQSRHRTLAPTTR
jgi:hypothetical protein